MQSTAVARRRYRAVGRTVASYGRKEKVQEDKRKQMVLDDDDNDEGIIWSQLPSSSSRSQKKKPHSIKDAINDNISCSRKHDKTMF